jgi:hypothetical protein
VAHGDKAGELQIAAVQWKSLNLRKLKAETPARQAEQRDTVHLKRPERRNCVYNGYKNSAAFARSFSSMSLYWKGSAHESGTR